MTTTGIIDTATRKLVSAYNDFGFRLLSELVARDADRNVFISSFSVAIALAMTYNGAEGMTKRAMAETLRLTGLGLPDVNEANAALVLMQGKLDPKVQLAVANSIWVRSGITLAPDFIQQIRDFYAGEVANLDFRDPGASDVINGWVARKTQEKIKELVTPDVIRTAILILINAIYFKGIWTKQFDKTKTEEGDFTLLDGSRKSHPMMSQSGRYKYFENADFQAISLPYGNSRISMYVFLPRQTSSIRDFQKSLNTESWQRWMAGFHEVEGDIVLPRFKVEYGAELNDALIALGMGVAFGPADFSGMGAGDLLISAVIHKAYIEVNEEGTEAAAATAVIMARSLGVSDRFRMVVDRPFFAAIRDNETGAVLFMGFVLDPTEG